MDTIKADASYWVDITCPQCGDGRPAVACMAVLATRPTIADAVAELRARPARAAREHRCLTCEEIRRLRACDYSDHDIAQRLEISPRALARHDNHEENTGT